MGANRRLNAGAVLAAAPVLLSIAFFATPHLTGRARQGFYTNGVDRKYVWTTSVLSPDHKTQASIEVAKLIGTPEGANSCLYLDARVVYPTNRKVCNPRPRDIYDGIHVFLTPPEWSPDGRQVATIARIFDWEYTDPYGKYFDGTLTNDRYFLVIAALDHPTAGYPLKPSLDNPPNLEWMGDTRVAADGQTFDLTTNPPAPIP